MTNFKRIRKMENRISDIEDKVEEIDTLVKENVVLKKKTRKQKTSRNLGHHEKTKSTNNRCRGQRRTLDQRHRGR